MEFELSTPEDAKGFLSEVRLQQSAKAERDPDIGDAVHFWDDESAACMAATVADVKTETECLAVLDPQREEVRWLHSIPHSETKHRLSWHWPCGGH